MEPDGRPAVSIDLRAHRPLGSITLLVLVLMVLMQLVRVRMLVQQQPMF